MRHTGVLLAVLFLFTACRTPESLVLREQLKAQPEWLVVRSAAQAAIAKNESVSVRWKAAMALSDTGAIYPVKKIGEVWLVEACDDYPRNLYGVVVEMEISEAGEVRRYTQLWELRKEMNRIPELTPEGAAQH